MKGQTLGSSWLFDPWMTSSIALCLHSNALIVEWCLYQHCESRDCGLSLMQLYHCEPFSSQALAAYIN